MMWTLQSFLGTFIDATVGQMVHALGTSGTSRPLPFWEPASRETAAPDWDSRDLQDNSLKLVRYTLVSVRRCEEKILPDGSGEILVTGGMTADGFAAWVIAEYLQPDGESGRRHRIPLDEKRYIRVSYQVLARWPLKCKSKKTEALEGIRDALRGVSPRPVVTPAPVSPPSILTWGGSGTPSQVGGRGRVTLTKAWNGKNYDVTLEGTLAIESRTYGFVRHGLPPGYLPVSADPRAYTCEIQRNERAGDTSGVDNYGSQGVHVRRGDLPGYEGRATLWFPEKHYNGGYTLRCTWQTNEETPT